MAPELRGMTKDEIQEWFSEEGDSRLDQAVFPSKDPGEKYALSQLRVVRESKDYQLDYLQHALRPGRELIDISPAYQRRLRWSNQKKSLLIESFLLNIPVPPIFLFEKDYNEYEVIDGRQRLDAISSFLNNEFALTGLEYWPELKGKRFGQLPQVLQKGLLRRSLPAVVLLAETETPNHDGLDVRRVLFDRLNTGGVQLNPQELRNALYPGELNDLLIRLARKDDFTSTWGIPPYHEEEDSSPSDELLKTPMYASLADAELVLRFFAIRDAILSNRKGSLRAILDRYMEANAKLTPEKEAELERTFTDNLSRLKALFGQDTFRLPDNQRLSRPLYDALMVASSLQGSESFEADRDQIRAALKEALDDDDQYDILVGRGNTIDSIRQRIELAGEILQAAHES